MDAFKDALKKKIDQLKTQGGPGAAGMGHEEEADKSPDMAPSLQGSGVAADAAGAAEAGDAEGDDESNEIDLSSLSHDDMQKILEALSDKGPMGRPSQGLGERVGQDAKAKLMSMQGKK